MARSSRRDVGLLLLLTPLAIAQTLTNLPNLSTVSNGAAGTNTIFHLTGLPTIAGAGIPKLVVPDTANAPYMQKSSLPEGTFFIAVGATLAFLGACVLLWRAMVAWSINRSVKRTALASIGSRSEKTGHASVYGGWAGSRKSSGYHGLSKPGFYKDSEGTSVSLENLTSAGKHVKPHFRDSTIERSSTPPQDLFFSPTAHARETHTPNRSISGYMPAGFYASPSAQPAGGAGNTTIGASLAPYAQQHKRHSTQGSQMSRSSLPMSAESQSRDRTTRGVSRDSPLNSRDGGLRGPSRDGRNNHFYESPSNSSLMVGQSSRGSDTPNRAPSAYLEDLFDNHGNGPRERF